MILLIDEMNSPQTAQAVLKSAGEALSQSGFGDPDMEARFLLSGLLRVPLTDFYINPDRLLDQTTISKFKKMVDRRALREPVAYILGWHQFMGFEFKTDLRGLIPRPETELLVEKATEWLKTRKLTKPKILDMGTGSGCIGVSLARLFPNAEVVMVDISREALDLANLNVKNQSNITLIQSDLFTELSTDKHGDFDMIISNPPYVSTSELALLEPDLTYEPLTALDGGRDGFSITHRLIRDAVPFLKKNGVFLFEIGFKQGIHAEQMLELAGFARIQIYKDYQGLDRIVKGEISGSI